MRQAVAQIVLACAILIAGGVRALAMPVLISESPWGADEDFQNFTTVFGAGGFVSYSTFSGADPTAIFVPNNNFVMVEGGADSDAAFQTYLADNQGSILNWVQDGGTLLLQSAGWDPGTYGIGPGSLVQDLYFNASNCGTLTPAGRSMLTGTDPTQCGEYLAHDYVSGTGLTALMIGSNTGATIIAETQYGNGYIVYSGLTDSEWNYSGPSLVNSLIIRSDHLPVQTIPEPYGVTLLAMGLSALPVVRRSRSAFPHRARLRTLG